MLPSLNRIPQIEQYVLDYLDDLQHQHFEGILRQIIRID